MREISLIKLIKVVLSKLWLVILCAAVFGVGAFFYTSNTTVPMYKSESLIFISNYDKGPGSQTQMSAASMEASEHVLSRYVVLIDKVDVIYTTAIDRIDELKRGYIEGLEGYEDFGYLFESNKSAEEMAELREQYLNGLIEYEAVLELLKEKKFTPGELKSMISVGQNQETEILSIYASSSDPQIAQVVSHAVTYSLNKLANSLLGGSNSILIQDAKLPTAAASPVQKYTIFGAFIGAFIVIIILVLKTVFDVTIRTENDLIEVFPKIPVLGVIPDIDSAGSKRGYTYTMKNE